MTHENDETDVAETAEPKNIGNTNRVPARCAVKYIGRETPSASVAAATPVSRDRPIVLTMAGTANRGPKMKRPESPVSLASLPGAPNLWYWNAGSTWMANAATANRMAESGCDIVSIAAVRAIATNRRISDYRR